MSVPRHSSAARAGAFSPTSPGAPAAEDPARDGPTRNDPAANASAMTVSAMSIEDYARAVQVRTEFVDFLLAPARGELAAAA